MEGSKALSGESIFTIKKELDQNVREAEFVEREQFIGLIVGPDQFLLPISSISEIMMLPPITYLPQAPRFVEGVINLRGTILPAINLRKMFGMTRADPTMGSRIIIARHDDIIVGLLVDGISSVESLLPTEVEENVLTNKVLGLDLLGRLSKKQDKVRGILDIAKIVKAIRGTNSDDEEDEAA